MVKNAKYNHLDVGEGVLRGEIGEGEGRRQTTWFWE